MEFAKPTRRPGPGERRLLIMNNCNGTERHVLDLQEAYDCIIKWLDDSKPEALFDSNLDRLLDAVQDTTHSDQEPHPHYEYDPFLMENFFVPLTIS